MSREVPVPTEPAVPSAPRILRWGTVRTALALFATGWIMFQIAATVVLGLNQFGAELHLSVALFLSFISSVFYVVGSVLFVTGMGMTWVVPQGTGAGYLAWGLLACLLLGALAWGLFNLAGYQNREIIQEIRLEIQQQGQNPQARPPDKAKLEREWARQWQPGFFKGLLLTFLGTLGFAKILFTCFLWALARHFHRPTLAAGLLIYLLAEALGISLALSILFRQPRGIGDPVEVFTGSWYAVGITSAFCAWFLVYLFQVRRAIFRALIGGPIED